MRRCPPCPAAEGRRRLTDRAAAMWLRHLKPGELIGRRDGDELEARRIGEMVEAEWEELEREGWELGKAAHSTAISVVARYGNAVAAQRFFDRMRNKCISPDRASCNSLMNAYANKGDHTGFLRAYRTAVQDCADPPDEATLAVVLSALQRRGLKEEVFAAAAAFQEQGLKLHRPAWNTLVAACDSWAEASDTLRRMGEAGFPPDVVSYGAALKACAKACDKAGAEQAWRELQGAGLVPTVREWTALLAVCKACGDLSGCRDVLQRMRAARVQPNAVTYGTVFRALSDASKGADSAELAALRTEGLRHWRDAVRGGAVTSPRLYTLAAELAAACGDADFAEQLQRHLHAAGLREEGAFRRYCAAALQHRAEGGQRADGALRHQ
eukprot:TRINITY_DN34060_c0_g1_i1.p1 TRINITY_DN34060_c0_g1~~TRINITY_DN34060_c0_g1_i1.p1  ORF type:complete len:411 (+),score=114.11 TRINITY_DN34060_c0_g1_i1:87-1235(+)